MCGKKPQNGRPAGKPDTEKRVQTEPRNQQQSSGRKVPPNVPRPENVPAHRPVPASLEKQAELRSRQPNTAGQHKPREVRADLSKSSGHRPAPLPPPVPEISELEPNVPDIKTHPPQILSSIQEGRGDITFFCRWNGASKAVHYVKEAILQKHHPRLVYEFREGAIAADKEYDEVVRRGRRMPVRSHRQRMSEWDYELSYPGENYQKEKERMARLHRDRPRDPLRLEQLIKDYEAARPKGVPSGIQKQARMSHEGTSSSAAKRPRLETSRVIDLRMQQPAVPSTSRAGKPHHSSFASVVNVSAANSRQRATSKNHGVPGPQNSSSSSTSKRPMASRPLASGVGSSSSAFERQMASRPLASGVGSSSSTFERPVASRLLASDVGSSSSTFKRPVASRPLAFGVGSASSNYDRSMDYGKRFQAGMPLNVGSEVQVLPSSTPRVAKRARGEGASQARLADTINNVPGAIGSPVPPVMNIKIEPWSPPNWK